MGSIGAPELIVIVLIALLLFGAGRIADIGKGLGQGIKNFKSGLKDVDKDEDDKKPAALEAKSSTATATADKKEAKEA